MKNKKLWFWLGVAFIVVLFVTVIVTSVLLSQRRDELAKLPEIENIVSLK